MSRRIQPCSKPTCQYYAFHAKKFGIENICKIFVQNTFANYESESVRKRLAIFALWAIFLAKSLSSSNEKVQKSGNPLKNKINSPDKSQFSGSKETSLSDALSLKTLPTLVCSCRNSFTCDHPNHAKINGIFFQELIIKHVKHVYQRLWKHPNFLVWFLL